MPTRRRALRALLATALVSSLPVVALARPAAAVTGDLLLSEYVEGSSFNKAVEVYNGTGASIDLATAGYTLELYSNGAATPSQTVSLTGTLADGDVLVAAHASADATILAVADIISSAVINFNGDDTLVLRRGDTMVDSFGQVGVDPGTEWPGGGADDTLRRTATTCTGDVVVDDPFDAATSWSVLPVDTFDGLGAHTADCTGDPDPDPDPVATLISAVQGTGPTVTTTDPVVVTAVVVGDFQGDDQLRGFFLQEEDVDADADPATSEGIFVFCGACTADVALGDQVEVVGAPSDFFGMSQLDPTSVTVLASGVALPTPAVVDLPASGPTDDPATFEAVEGMLVRFADELVVSEYFELARYGQLVLTAGDRPTQFTDANEPDVAGYTTFLDQLKRQRIVLDDDNNRQNDPLDFDDPSADTPYFWPRAGLSTTNVLRGGDRIVELTGVMHWSFAGQSGTDAWRIRPVEPAFSYDFTSANPRPTTPDDVGGSFRVASFNVLNYFTTLDSRGADSVAELDQQRLKTAAAICALDADVVGLIEIENNGLVALTDLLDGAGGVNTTCGLYAAIDTGVIGTDEIAVAFVHRVATATPVGGHAVLDSTVDPRFDDTLNRPALAQTFADAAGARVTVVVNHLKSKGSACDDVGDPDVGDGQANCNLTRAAAAEAMVDWLATDPTGSGDPDVVIVGDLNSYRNEDPIDRIEAGSDGVAGTPDDYTDLLDTLIGPSAYSYVFDGQLGYLDHALANATLLPQVTGTTVWHTNADEVPLLDYNDGVLDEGESSFERESTALPLDDPGPWRASDHDAVLVGLALTPPLPVYTCGALTGTRAELAALGYRLVLGTEGRDVIVLAGRSARHLVLAGGGDDRIVLGRTGDVVCAGEGDDIVVATRGAHTVYGEGGDDLITAGAGDDLLDGGAGNDVLAGGPGIDTIAGGPGFDVCAGGAGRDIDAGGCEIRLSL